MTVQTSPAGTSAGIGLPAATALAWLAVWPVVMGVLTLFADMPPLMARPVTVALASVAFIVAGLTVRAPSGTLRFAFWQVAAAAVAMAVLFAGLDWVAPDVFAVAARLVVFAGGAGAALWLARQGEGTVRLLLYVLIGSMLAYLAFYVLLHGVMLAKAEGKWRVSFYPFVNIRQFTNTLAPVTLVAMLLWAQSASARAANTGRATVLSAIGPVPLALAALVLCTAVFWSGGRGPVLAILCGLAAALWIAPRPDRAPLSRRLAGMLAAASALSLVPPRVEASFGFWQRLLNLRTAETLDDVTSRRAGLWTETWELVLQKPWFGHGFNSWVGQDPFFALHGSPHNFPLEVLHDLGFIGGGAVLVIVFGTAFLRLRQARGQRGLFPVVVAMLWAMVAQSGVDAIFWSYTSLMLVTLCFAMCCALQPARPAADGP